MSVIAISFLIILFLLQIFLPKTRLNQSGFLFFIIALILVFGFAGFNSWQQYQAWQAGEATKFLLPPYQTFDYFIFYARMKFLNPHLLSLLAGLLFFFGAKKLNKKYQERFFEPIEPYFLLISLFLSGTPGWIAYLFIFFAVYLFINISITIYHLLITKTESPRVPLFYLWLPSGIFTILISKWLSVLTWWSLLKF